MQGDFSRLSFDADKDYRAVLLQQGRVLLDSDWNEQAERTAYRDDQRALDTFGAHGGPARSAGFGIVGPGGEVPGSTTWTDLFLTPGVYYVDGIRCAVGPAKVAINATPGQPYLPGGLPVPAATTNRVLLYLDVWTRHVTADEDAALRESALGGVDTTTRAQTVWQVLSQPLGATDDPLTAIAALAGPPGNTMMPALDQGVFTQLDNQLYRVQIHRPSGDDGPTFLWSRENGSVTAKLLSITSNATDVVLKVDRVGRDDALSIGSDAVVEVTSTARELRGRPGFLAQVTAANDTQLTVRWIAPVPLPAELTDLLDPQRGVPLVRRWERGPTNATGTAQQLEGGISVTFPGPGPYRTGDYWLVPARAARLGYGIVGAAGTIDWPLDPQGHQTARPPHGPVHHLAPLAVLSRQGTKWKRDLDLRRLAPVLTELRTLDIFDGDAQQAGSDGALPTKTVRFIARNGGLPVSDVPIQATASDGGGVTGVNGAAIVTDKDGIAAVTWKLKVGGPPAQTLTAKWPVGPGRPEVPDVVASARFAPAAAGTTTITLSPALLPTGETPVPYNRSFVQAAAPDKNFSGWMPVQLPDGYKIESMTVYAKRAAATAGLTSGALKVRLRFHQILKDDGSLADLTTSSVNIINNDGAPVGQSATSQPPLAIIISRGDDVVDNNKRRYFIEVLSDAGTTTTGEGTAVYAIRIVCRPLGST